MTPLNKATSFVSNVAVAIFLAVMPLASLADTQSPQMSLSATGTATAAPDMAVITVAVQGTGVDAAEAMSKNSAKMKAVFDALMAKGMTMDDISTSGLTLTPRYDNTAKTTQSPRILGYTVGNQVIVTLPDVTQVGTVLDEIVRAGVNAIQTVAFDIKDKSSLEQAARKDAAAKVAQMATDYAGALGTEIVGILSVSQNSSPSVPNIGLRAVSMEATSVPVSAGDVTVSVTLNVTYELTGVLK